MARAERDGRTVELPRVHVGNVTASCRSFCSIPHSVRPRVPNGSPSRSLSRTQIRRTQSHRASEPSLLASRNAWPLYDVPEMGIRLDIAEKQTPGWGVDSAAGPTRTAPRTFNQWLRAQLKARKLTQRQLAQKSGVDHSTISRLMRGDRVPSLHTATLLSRGLGIPQDPGGLDADGLGERGSPAARVEYALRSDDLLSEADVRHVMNVYLAVRLHSPRHDATPAVARATSRTPVPIVVEVHGMRSRSASSRRPLNATRGRLG